MSDQLFNRASNEVESYYEGDTAVEDMAYSENPELTSWPYNATHLMISNTSDNSVINNVVVTTTTSPAQEKQLHEVEFWINAVLTNITVVFGLICNILTIIILSKRAMRSSTNIYLCALAVWDCIVLVSSMLMIGLRSIQEFEIYHYYAHPYVVSYFYPVALIAQTGTIWLTVSFTVERYIAVCHPLRAATMCTISRAKIVIIGVSIGATLYNIPRWFEYRPSHVIQAETNRSIVIIQPTEFGQNPTYNKMYFSWLYVPIMCIIPLLTLMIINTFLILAVKKSQAQRRDMNVRQSRENNVTIMLVTVVIVFIGCQVPALVYNLMYAINREYVGNSFGYKVLSPVRNYLVCFNSAVNFLLYCALGQKFRRIFLHTFFHKCVRDSYMPMSGVYPSQSVACAQTQRRFATNRPPERLVKPMNSLNHSQLTLQTTCASSQESSLISPSGLSPSHNSHNCEMHTYAVMRDKRKRHVDSDDDPPPYDICLLPNADGTENELLHPTKQPNGNSKET